jgi:2-O-methyltransferase
MEPDIFDVLLDDIAPRIKGRVTVFDLGACDGAQTEMLAKTFSIFTNDFEIHAFEPVQKNFFSMIDKLQNWSEYIVLNKKAVGNTDGTIDFYEAYGIGKESYYGSSSLKEPKNTLIAWPDMKFRKTQVECVKLDSYCLNKGIHEIEFIWADLQGAEEELILGAQKALAKTKWLYTEYCDGELYKNELTLQGILNLLPKWKIHTNFGGDVLLYNTKLVCL